MRDYWTFASAGELVFGSGAVEQLGRLVAHRRWQRVLIVTDPALVKAGVLEPVSKSLAQAQRTCEVFSGGEPEPAVATAVRAAEAATGFRPDAILGLGGGSNMDLAKAAALLLKHGGAPADYFGFDRIPGPILPVIAVPTTAGTGSEVSHSAVLTDTVHHVKVSTLSPYLRPALAVVDPRLTRTCPPRAAADAGIDALTHAIEAYTAVDFSQLAVPNSESAPYSGKMPLGDCLAGKAIELIGRHLVRSVVEPGNDEAREGMSLAATLAGLAFSNSAVAVVHALEYPIGAALHCSHGSGNGLLLPFVMRYNLPVRTREFARIAALLGEDISQLADAEAAKAAISHVEKVRLRLGIPPRLRDLGATEDQLPAFADKAFAITRLMLLNPRRPTRDELLGIYREAF